MVAFHDASAGYDVAVNVYDGQDVAGLGFLAALISHGVTTFLGERVSAIQVEFR
jgi:hypothetical protein